MPMTALPDHVRAFLAGRHFLSLATLDADGAPRQSVIWYTLDGQEIVVNSAVGRRWPANLVRDGRVSLAITDRDDGYRWVGLTGTAVAVTDQPSAQADIAAMARHYHSDDPAEAEALIRDRFTKQVRISFRIAISSHYDHLA